MIAQVLCLTGQIMEVDAGVPLQDKGLFAIAVRYLLQSLFYFLYNYRT